MNDKPINKTRDNPIKIMYTQANYNYYIYKNKLLNQINIIFLLNYRLYKFQNEKLFGSIRFRSEKNSVFRFGTEKSSIFSARCQFGSLNRNRTKKPSFF